MSTARSPARPSMAAAVEPARPPPTMATSVCRMGRLRSRRPSLQPKGLMKLEGTGETSRGLAYLEALKRVNAAKGAELTICDQQRVTGARPGTIYLGMVAT